VYSDVNVVGAANVPRDRPVIFAANHSNALGDVAIMIAKLRDFPHFLATATWWKRAAVRALFRFGGVVPIHRRRDGGGVAKNFSSFEACYAALADGANLAIFPEGEMHSEPSLLPLKTGAARIALGAADVGVSRVVIVPVGLVYESRGRFRSHVQLTFGLPIEIDDWLPLHRENSNKAVRELTDLLADALARATINHESQDEASLVNRAAEYAIDDGSLKGTFARRIALRRSLGDALSRDDHLRDDLADRVREHERDLDALGLRSGPPIGLTPLSRAERNELQTSLAVLVAPASVGLVANLPVAVVAGFVGGRKGEAWQMTYKGVGGTLLCPVVWSAEAALLSRRFGARKGVAISVVGALCGVFALRFYDRFAQYRSDTALQHMARRRPAELDQARASREAVCQLVAKAAVDL
jgi:1-acyl-sn-glycerol-3-phosphate acyltransferase